VFTAAIGSETKETTAAMDLIEYLKSPAAVAIIKSKGMNPG
jgi:molybdate transport system substrate-binding protein